MRPLMFFVQKMAKFWRFSVFGGQGLEKVSIFTAKGTSVRGSTSFAIFHVKIGWGCDLQVGWGKNKVTNIVYFTYLPRSPRCSNRYQICSGGWYPEHNQLCQISFQSVQGFWFCRGSNFGLSYRNEASPLTHGLNYHSACDVRYMKEDTRGGQKVLSLTHLNER